LKNEKIDLILVSFNISHLINCSIASSLYFKTLNLNNAQYFKCYQSKLNLEKLYDFLFGIYYSPKFQNKPKLSPESILLRSLLKTLQNSQFLRLDGLPIFPQNTHQLFHSTYYKLPPENITQNLPRVITIYDLIPLTAKQYVPPILTNYFNEILESINYDKDWAICISEYTRQEFCDYTGMSLNRTTVMPLAADEHFQPVLEQNLIREACQRYKIPQNPYFLCLASQLELRKNIPHLINSFIKLLQEKPNLEVNLVLIGTLRYASKEMSKLMEKVPQFKERIIITGYVPDEDLSALYSGAVAFVFPSLYEGFGLPVLESMQCGTPVICSNATSLPEVAGDAAILVSPTDEDELCQAMLNLLTDSALQQDLRQRGLERAKQFTWSKAADKVVDLYQRVIQES
jgi:glycosyltransferase involved in cell wall biosynthesis